MPILVSRRCEHRRGAASGLHMMSLISAATLEQPGATAIIVLAIATPSSIALGVTLARDRIDCHSISLGFCALIFWVWALYKVVRTGAHDVGAITFALVLLAACTTVQWRIQHPGAGGYSTTREAKVSRAVKAQWRLGFASIAVMLNYGLAALLLELEHDVFRLYLIFGAAWWACAASWTCTAFNSYVKQLKNSGGFDAEEEALQELSELQDEDSSWRALGGRWRTFLAQ